MATRRRAREVRADDKQEVEAVEDDEDEAFADEDDADDDETVDDEDEAVEDDAGAGDVEDGDPLDAEGAPGAGGVAAIRQGTKLASSLTRRDAEGVVSMRATNEGGWSVGVEVVETRRIPDSADILAVYEVELDEDLELVGFLRTRRYLRGRGDQ